MDLDQARARIRSRPDLHAFISVSTESGRGTVVAVKDLVDVKGMVTTAGGILLPNTPATDDAPVIKRIRQAGCVVVGKANLHEFAYGVTSLNPHYGNVLNPHDTTRVAGGSSGGSAVAVAAGMCDWAIGSDTGGSIRIPGSLCGVTGFKPAFGSIEITGVVPLSPALDTLGPLAPDVASTAAGFGAMSGEVVPLDALERPRLAVPQSWVSGLDAATQAAWTFVSRGIDEIEFVPREALFRVGLTILLYEAARYHRHWVESSPEKYGGDVLRLLQQGLAVTPSEYDSALAERIQLARSADDAMSEVDALLLPATALVAPPVDAGPEVREQLTRFTRPFNASHQPVVIVPAPVTGLPVGMQVVGRTNAGALRAAAWLEREWRNKAA